MMRSLYSGVSGLKVHQTKMDVIGNNIANVNTVGFKGSSVNFSDVFYQTTSSAAGPNADTGLAGRNALQIGLGSNLASISTNMSVAGGSQRTDNPFDVMISGDGFFVVNKGGTNYFTKSGAFQIDGAGTLCTSEGANVMGWQVDKNGNIVKAPVSPLRVMSPENLYAEPEATTQAYISGNIDQEDEQLFSDAGYMTQVNFYDNVGNSYMAKLVVKQLMTTPAAPASPEPVKGQYTVTVADIVGENDQSIFAVKKADGTYGRAAYDSAGTTPPTFTFGGVTYTVATDDLTATPPVYGVNPTTGAVTLVVATTSAAPSTILAFNNTNGHFTGIYPSNAATGTAQEGKNALLNLSGVLAAANNPFPAGGLTIDFSSITKFASDKSTSSLESQKGNPVTGLGTGLPVGNMNGISIDPAGKIYGTYDNGTKKLLGQIVVATFANPSGLEAVGDRMFAQTRNSGDFDGMGQDPTLNGGGLSTGVLEMSNVDLSNEFTQMITTQRGFQANSRIITTSDTLLEELINLKR